MRFHRLIMMALVVMDASLLAWGQSAGLNSIRKAGTASEAIGAYAQAIAGSTDRTLAQQAFVDRMIELGSPELAEAQAREVTMYANDGQAWGVLAYVDAQQNRIDTALEKIVKAVKLAPSNEFVQTTAGQIVAWYDLRDDQATLPEPVKQSAEELRGMSSRSRAFTHSYDEAKRILTEGVSEDGGGAMPVNIVGSLEELGTYSGYTTGSVPGLVSYWSSPYLYPGYALEPWWADYRYQSHWAFPPVRLRDVSRDVRYIRMPGDRGFVLVDGLGATVVPTHPGFWRSPYYAWQADPWYANGYGGGYGYGNVGYGGLGRRTGHINYPGRTVWGPGVGNPYPVWGPGIGYGFYYNQTLGGGTRLGQRMGPGPGLSYPRRGGSVGSGFGNPDGGGRRGGGQGGGGQGGRGMR